MTKRTFGRPPWRMYFWAAAIMASSLLAAQWVKARVGAQVDQELLELSRTFNELLQQSHLDSARAPRAPSNAYVEFNGIRIRAETRHIKASRSELNALLSTLRAQCQAPDTLANLGQEAAWSAPVLESITPKESYLYCLQPRAPFTLSNLRSLAQEFATSLDVAQLGQLRGLYVRSHGDEHHLLMVQLEGSVELSRAFSQVSDSPGRDFTDLLRPAGRRSASISLNGAPALNVYQLADDSGFTLGDYAEQLNRNGAFLLSPPPASAGTPLSVVARTKDNAYVLVLHPGTGPRHGPRLSITRLPS